MSLENVISVVLAAGKGTRMKSELPKVATLLAGKPLLTHVLDSLQSAGISKKVIIVGFKKEVVEEIANKSPNVEFAIQAEQLGTGHALLCAEKNLSSFSGTVLVACGDVPLLSPKTFSALLKFHKEQAYAATILTCDFQNPKGYGRILRNGDGDVVAIREEKDATDAERQVTEINTGTYCFDSQNLFANLKQLGNSNAQKEYYLTDLISVLREQGKRVGAYKLENPNETKGVNSPEDLQELENLLLQAGAKK